MAIHETMLRDALVALAEQSKQQYLELAGVITEVAALHKTIQQSDPTFAEKLAKQKALPKPIQSTAAAIERFDEIIRRLRTDVIHN
jgi:hypothetical protein